MHTRLGDIVEKAVKPVAKALNHPCLDEQGSLRPQSTCARIRGGLNNLGDAVWDFLWTDQSKDKKE